MLPTETIIVAATGERYRGVCNYKSHDTWNWSLQTSRAAGFEGASHLECSVCMSALREPAKWPAHPSAEGCRHVFCRGCVVRCLSAEQTSGCPLCRARPADGMTALKARSCRLTPTLRRRLQPTPWSRSSASPCRLAPSPTRRPTGGSVNGRRRQRSRRRHPHRLADRRRDSALRRRRARLARHTLPKHPGRATEAGAAQAAGRRVHQADERRAAGQAHRREADGARRGGGLPGGQVEGADVAVFLAVLTEMYWARGRGNLNPLPRDVGFFRQPRSV